jgi:hypothetical protein
MKEEIPDVWSKFRNKEFGYQTIFLLFKLGPLRVMTHM